MAAAAWFAGDNDAGLAMFDSTLAAATTGCTTHAVNKNQGAESTLAYVSTMHRAAAVGDGRMTLTITDTDIELRPDHHRVVIRLFVPGLEDVGPGDSRASAVLDRVLQLSEPERQGDARRPRCPVRGDATAICTPRSVTMPSNSSRTCRAARK